MVANVPALEVRGLEKSFGGVPVLRGVSFAIKPGEVVALAGENGAGKSTLMKIVTGQVRQDAGEVFIHGEAVTHLDPLRARRMGVSIVPQELAPYPDLTVYENLFVGREVRNRFGILNRRQMIDEARSMLEVFDVDIDPRTAMNRLSVALTQIIEIAKSTTWGAKVLLLDEPTSSIPDREVAQLYGVVRKLREQGVGMLYTTHKMEEIQELADTVVVLRDGHLVLDKRLGETTSDGIVKAMIGRELGNMFPAAAPPQTEVGLSVRDLMLRRGGPTISLSVNKGEILGLAGLVGAGRTEILEALFGIRRAVDGILEIDGREVPLNAPAKAISAGVALVPEDRKGAGLVLTRSVLDNVSLPHLESYARAGWIRTKQQRVTVERATRSVELRARGLDQLVGRLSGGNQQKVVVARWLTHNTRVLLLDEPTRGVDVGARGEIYRIIRDLAASGMAVILVSSDMPELIGLSHRVLVVRAGEVVGALARVDLDRDNVQEQIFRLASGQTQAESPHTAA